MKRLLVLMSSAILTTLLSASPTFAGDHGFAYDYKNYPGLACQPQFGTESGDFQRSTSYIVNVAIREGGVRRVVCPITRDNASPSKAIDASVTVSSEIKDCSFFSMDRAGNIVAEVFSNQSEIVGPSIVRLYFALSEGQIAFDGMFSIRCTLPPLTAVYGYNVGELTDSTDTNS